MGKETTSAGQGAVLLTALGAASQLLGFGYRVALARMVGAQVMGLYQLLMPVYAVLLSLTAIGLTAAVSNLTAQYLARGNARGADQALGTCLKLFALVLLPVGGWLILASDFVSVSLLGDARTQLGLILLVPCVALTGVENFHKHWFYGAGLVRPPAVTELCEQLVRAAAVLGLLWLFLPQYPERAVGLVVAGMVLCEVFSAATLAVLYRRHCRGSLPGPGEPGTVRRRRIAAIALPVGLNALLGNLLGAANAALIPQKLVEGGMAREDAIAQLGVVCGMTLPMLALPTVFLGALNLVLLPRLARARALDRWDRVRQLAQRALSIVGVLALPAMAWMAVVGSALGQLLFGRPVDGYLLPLAAVMALSCFCSVLGAILNGVGRQGTVAAISLLGGGVQLALTLVLVPLPGVGMGGYVVGALVSAGLEALLCLVLTLRHTGLALRPLPWLIAPGLAALLSALTMALLQRRLLACGLGALPSAGACLVFGVVLYLAALSAQGVELRRIFRLRG
mgnify:FL=1